MPSTELPPDLLTSFASADSEVGRAALLRSERLLHHPEAVTALCDQASHWAREDPTRARKAADAALWLAKSLSHSPSEGLAHRTLANIFTALSRYPEAFSEYTAALEIFESLDDRLQVAITKSSAFPAVVDTLGAESAFEWATQAREAFLEIGDRLRLARLENNLAVIHYRREDYERALEHWREADSTLQEIGEKSDQAATLRNLAVCSISLNRPEEAQAYYRRARELCVASNFTYLLHEIDYNIAYLHYLQGDHHLALNLYQVARERSRQLHDTYHEALCSLDETEIYLELNLLQEAQTVAQLAAAQFSQLKKPYEQAKALFFLALVLFRRADSRGALAHLASASQAFSGQGNILWPGQVELLRASIYASEGRFFEAIRSAESALELFQDSGLTRRASLAQLLIAKVFYSQGALERSDELCRQAVAALEPFREPDSLFQAYFLLGKIQDLQGDREAALGSLRTAEKHLLELRERRIASQIRVSIFNQPLDVYAHTVGLLIGGKSEIALSEELFRLVETAKARSFADLMALSGVRPRSATTMRSQLVDQVSTLRQELTWLYRRIERSELPDGGAKKSVVESLQRQSQAKERELARTLSSLRVEQSDVQFDPERIGIVDVAAVRDLICSSTLLEYYVADDLVVAVVLSSEQAKVQPIAVVSKVRDLQRRLWHHLFHASASAPQHQISATVLSILGDLYSELVLPLEKLLGDSAVIIAPHGPLFLVPFHALHKDGDFLITRVPVSYAPSAAALTTTSPTGPVQLGTLEVTSSQVDIEPAAVFPPALQGRSLHKQSLPKQQPERPPTAAHMIGDALLRADNPLFSALRYGSEEVTFLDLHRTRMFGPIISLEGGGFAPNNPSDDRVVQALWGALLASGARCALVPTGVGSQSTQREQARLFYAEMSRGVPSAEAHRRATLQVIEAGAPLHEWSGTLLVGDPFLRLPNSDVSA